MNNPNIHPFTQFLVDSYIASVSPKPNAKPTPKWRIKAPTGEFITTASRKTIWRNKRAATSALTRDINCRLHYGMWNCTGQYPNYMYSLQSPNYNNHYMTRDEKDDFMRKAKEEIKKLYQVVEVSS